MLDLGGQFYVLGNQEFKKVVNLFIHRDFKKIGTQSVFIKIMFVPFDIYC